MVEALDRMTIPLLIYMYLRLLAYTRSLTLALDAKSRMIDIIDPQTGQVTAVCGCCGRKL